MLNEVKEESGAAVRAPLQRSTRAYGPQDEAADLITSQIAFGLAYAKEARAASAGGHLEYAGIARKIALNAYAAALRFSEHLLTEPQRSLLSQIEALEFELEGLLDPVEQGLRSIA